jgi:EAL domain-containing protein (putative c-di-GMP-specific phosphodiesterase class I)
MREAHEYLEKDRQRHRDEDAEDSRLRKHIKQGLIDRILDGSFHVFLQPKVSVAEEKRVGAEALIRLYDEVRKIVSPAYFIPLLEQRDMIYIIDLFVLKQVLIFQKAALDAGKEVVPISVNFSKNTLMMEGLIPYIQGLCEEYPIPSGLVQIEITETISSMDHMLVNKIANSLRHMGFSMSMDDFGAQYSNIAVLTQFDFDAVKIDRSLLANVEANNKCGMVLKHTISMLKALGMETVMEGVETREQVEVLRELGCDTIQGFYYGKPEPHEKFYELYMSDK